MSTSNTYALRSRAIVAFRPHIHSGVRTAGVVCILAWLQAGPAATREQIAKALGITSHKGVVNVVLRAMRSAGLIRHCGYRPAGSHRAPSRLYAAGPEHGDVIGSWYGQGSHIAQRVAALLGKLDTPSTVIELGDAIGHRHSNDHEVLRVMHEAGLVHIAGWRFSKGNAGPMVPRYRIGAGPDVPAPESAKLSSVINSQPRPGRKAAAEARRAAAAEKREAVAARRAAAAVAAEPATPVASRSIAIGDPIRAEQLAMLFALAGHNTLGVHA